jgi:magnesium chelatase accessory protein
VYERLYPGMSWADHAAHWPLAAHSQHLSAGGVHWHVQRMGQGPALLLLHGTGSGSFSWRGLMPLLAAHFEVIAPDLPGHVFSSYGPPGALSLPGMSEALRALLLQLAVEPVALLGHSAGAAVAAHMVLHHPRLAGRPVVGLNPAWLPLGGAAAWLFPPMAWLARLNPASAWTLSRLARRAGAVEDTLARVGSHLDAQGLALYREVLAHPGHVHGVLQMMAAWQIAPLARALPRLTQPVLLHIGAQDRTVPPALSDQAMALLPHAERIVAQGLGHLAHEEDPAGTAAQLLPWLRMHTGH